MNESDYGLRDNRVSSGGNRLAKLIKSGIMHFVFYLLYVGVILVVAARVGAFRGRSRLSVGNSLAPNVTIGLTDSEASEQLPPLEAGILAFDADKKVATVQEGDSGAHFSFNFTNTSVKDVTISAVTTSCGCTAAELPSMPWVLPPHATGRIPVTMNLNGRTGRIPKSVTVRTLQGFKVLTVVAEVMPPSTNAEIAERERNQVLAKTDRQMVFKGDCATCHAERAKGKFGQELYVATCGICHDAKPRASMVPNLRALNHPTGHDFWKMMITNGKPGTLMPAFASDQGGPLTELQIESLTVFVDENIRAVAQLDGANGGGTNTVTPAKN